MQKKIIGALLLTAGLPLSALAVSLGDVELFSALNQPLNAEIEVKSISLSDAENLIAKLASEKDFVQNSIPRPYWLTGLKFTPITKKNGRSYIRVTSKNAIREPFVNFLVDMEWPKGRLIREYTLLLDPPAYLNEKPVAAPAAAPVLGKVDNNKGVAQIERDTLPDIDLSMDEGLQQPAKTAAKPAKSPAKPASSATTKASKATKKATPSTVSKRSEPQTGTIYKVQRGDIMNNIASTYQTDDLSLNQVLLAIVKNNRGAFIQGNVNLVKAGATLKIPSAQAMRAQSRAQASSWLAQQNLDWRQGAAGSAASAGAPSKDTGKTAYGGEPVPQVPELVDKSQLSIVSPDMGNKQASENIGSADNSASKTDELRHSLTMANERLAANNLRQQEVESRIAELENIAEQSKAVLDLKSQKLTQLQANAQVATPEPVAAEPEPAPAPEPAPVAKPKPAPAPAPVVNANRPSGVMGTIYDLIPAPIRNLVEPYFGSSSVFIILLVLLAIILLPLLLVLKKRQQKDEPLRPIKHENWQTGDLDDTVVETPKAGMGDKFKSMFKKKSKKPELSDDLLGQMDFGEDDTVAEPPLAKQVVEPDAEDSAVALSIDAEEDHAEPEADGADDSDAVVTEADVYIAYGLNDKAEELLQGAIAEKPHKSIYYVKLMETYKELDARDKFLATANQLQAMLAGAPSSSWDKALLLGREYMPEQTMFGGDGKPQAKQVQTANELVDNDLTTDLNDIELQSPAAADAVEDYFADATELVDLSAAQDNEVAASSEGLLDNEQIENILTGAFDDSFFEDVAPDKEKAPSHVEVLADLDADFDQAFGGDNTDITTANDADITSANTLLDNIDDLEQINDADSLADVLAVDGDLSIGDLEDITSADIDHDNGIDADENAFDLTGLESEAAQTNLSAKLQDLPDATGMIDKDGFDGTVGEQTEAELTQLIDDESLETMIDNIDVNTAEFSLDDGATPDNLDEVGTKLDLARAYIDMADYEGAKESLQEVIKEGSAEQQQEAQKLLLQAEQLS